MAWPAYYSQVLNLGNKNKDVCYCFTVGGSHQPADRANRLILHATAKIFCLLRRDDGRSAMSYKDHPDMSLAACSRCGGAGQVLVATGPEVAVYDASGKLLKTQTTENFIRTAGIDFDAWKSKPASPPRVKNV